MLICPGRKIGHTPNVQGKYETHPPGTVFASVMTPVVGGIHLLFTTNGGAGYGYATGVGNGSLVMVYSPGGPIQGNGQAGITPPPTLPKIPYAGILGVAMMTHTTVNTIIIAVSMFFFILFIFLVWYHGTDIV